MNIKGKFTFCLCVALPLLLTGQRDYSIAFHSGNPPGEVFLKPSAVTPAMMGEFSFGGRSRLLIQFEEIPGAEEMAVLDALGIGLLSYLPNYAYFASFPEHFNPVHLPEGIRAVLLPRAAWKLSAELARNDYPAHAMNSEGILLQVLPFGDIPSAALAESLVEAGYDPGTVLADRILLRAPVAEIKTLASLPAVMFLAPVEGPSFSEGLAHRSLVRSNLLGAGPLSGWDGSGVHVSLADDGTVSHLDMKGRIQNYTALNTGSHGDMTTGILIGAGNINPLGMGMAPGAFLHLYHINDYPHIVNAVANYLGSGIVITSTSYGDGCGGIYSLSARDLDAQVAVRRELLHVFSAGNSSQQSCGPYGALGYFSGARYGNITGGRKAAKHALLVGNLYFNDSLRTNSSRGPLNDGTLKTDLVAPGQGNLTTGPNNTYLNGGGTSAAAPVVAGLAAQLYQAYRSMHNNADPSFAHIKTAMFNTAEDLGRPGPDYDHGWGRPHAGRALKLVENNWFITGSVAHQGQNIHSITVPAGVQRLSIMVYWFDPAASPYAAKTLVNDLDLSLRTPSNAVVRPWVLSTAFHIDSITKPAYRGFDRVNVVEQVTLDNPQPGSYQIQIAGHLVPQGPQDYVIAYYIEEDGLAIAYPNGNEAFVPGESEVIRWDAPHGTEAFSLEFSADSMATWQIIADSIPGGRRYYQWVVPSLTTGSAFFRIRRDTFSDTSDAAFNIIGLPDFQIRNGGVQEGRISWPPVPGADRYTVFAMGERYMEEIGTTADTSFLFQAQPYATNWYSVRAGHTEGITGRRAYAKSYLHVPCQEAVQLTIKFDQFPAETRWEIRNAAGLVVAQGGPYAGQMAHSTMVESLCLPYGCFEFRIYDGYNDGLCCQNGDGFYKLINAAGVVIASGSQFGHMDTRTFCLDPPVAPLWATGSVLQQVLCNGGTDGIARVNAGGGTGTYTFLWSTGATSQVIANLPAGVYAVTVSDGQSQAPASVIIVQPPPLVITATPVAASDASNGSVNLTVAGGVAPYQFAWSNGAVTQNLSGLSAGTYTATVADANDCAASVSATVTGPGINYCPARAASTGFEWIQGVQIGNFQHLSGNNGGYADFTHLALSMTGGETYAVTLQPGYAGNSYTEYWKIWIDLDQDNYFDDLTELVFSATGQGVIQGGVTLPGAYTPGQTRMRVAMKYGGPASSCGNFPYGEVEDYTAVLAPPQGGSYCTSQGLNAGLEWIEEVSLGGMVNHSGVDDGYGDYTHLSAEAAPGGPLEVILTPGFAENNGGERWRVWIDFNRDGDFDDSGEQVLSTSLSNNPVHATIYMPASATPGPTRMRIAMRWGGWPGPCEVYDQGETEDYTLFISDSAGEAESGFRSENRNAQQDYAKINPGAESISQAGDGFLLYPNPASGHAALLFFSPVTLPASIEIARIDGLPLRKYRIDAHAGETRFDVNIEGLPEGMYWVSLQCGEMQQRKKLVIVR